MDSDIKKKLRRNGITFRKAAELAGLSYYEMLDLISEEGIDIGYDKKNLEKDLKRIETDSQK